MFSTWSPKLAVLWPCHAVVLKSVMFISLDHHSQTDLVHETVEPLNPGPGSLLTRCSVGTEGNTTIHLTEPDKTKGRKGQP
jgi:hypothetical protein